MSTHYTTKENSFGKTDILPLSKDDVTKIKATDLIQPLPGEDDSKVIEYVKSLMNESYEYKRKFHHFWYQNLKDYYISPNLKDSFSAGKNPAVASELDSEVMVPPLIKRYVDLGAFWLTREIYKIEPFTQFTYYSKDEDIRKSQKLLERKYQGDAETYGARERANEIFTDLFLYGNAVAKASFYQDRIATEMIEEFELDEDSLQKENSSNPLSNITNLADIQTGIDSFNFNELGEEEAPEEIEPNIKFKDPVPKYEIINQFAEFSPIFLGHFFIDPYCPNKDSRKARYMGDIQFMSTEEVIEKFGNIKGFTKKFKNSLPIAPNASMNSLPFSLGNDAFSNSWLNLDNGAGYAMASAHKSRKLNSVVYFYTRFTETVIINESVVAYHKYRDPKIKKAGPFPYVLLKFPCASASLFSLGLGHILRTLQQEQILLASQRLKMLNEVMTVFVEYVGGKVDEAKVENLKGLTFIEVDQPGAINFRTPPAGVEQMFLNSEARNFERAREYSGIPAILDSSSQKTHLGAVPQRMEAAQVQFDVILSRVRDNWKKLHQMMHILSMAYLEGDQPIEGSTNIVTQSGEENKLTEDQLQKLAMQPDLTLQLNAGYDVNSEKLKSFATLMNTPFVAEIIKQLVGSQTIELDKLAQSMGMLFDLAGITEFRSIFDVEEIKAKIEEQKQTQMQQQQMQMQQGVPPQGNVPPMPSQGGQGQPTPPPQG